MHLVLAVVKRIFVRRLALACAALAGILYSPMMAANLLKDGGFESSLTPSWTVDSKVTGWGLASVSTASWSIGRQVLRLSPNSFNSKTIPGVLPFGVGQGFSGQSNTASWLYLSATMAADGGAQAVVRVYIFLYDGSMRTTELRHRTSSGALLRRELIPVPERSVQAVVVICLVEGTIGSAYFDEVSISDTIPTSWKQATGEPDAGAELSARIDVDASKVGRTIPESLYGSNLEWPGGGQGIWDPVQQQLNPQIVGLTKLSGVNLLRFPGGLFADYYRWRQGVGPRSTRPIVEVMPGGPKSTQDFGTDEAVAFARSTGTRLLITVNLITGTPTEAADWVRYVNRNGLEVEYWEVGNESYVPGASALRPEAYANRFLEFARAMRAADPRIKIGAITDENFSATAPKAFGDWTGPLLAIAGNEIDFLSLHCGYAPGISRDFGWSSRTVYAATLAAPQIIRQHLEELDQRLAQLLPQKAIKLAVTEWGPYFQINPDGRFVDHPKTMASAVFTASLMKVWIESPRMEIANFFKLVDNAFMGWIGLRQGVFTDKAPLLALSMFRRFFGSVLVSSNTNSPTYDSPSVGWANAAAAVPYLETIATLSANRKKLYVMVINKHFDRSIQAQINLLGFFPQATGQLNRLSGTSPDANSGTELPFKSLINWAPQAGIAPGNRIDLGGPGEIGISTSTLSGMTKTFTHSFPPCSVTSFIFDAR